MQIETVIFIAQKYASLGNAIQVQMSSVVSGCPLEMQNPNALKIIAKFLDYCAAHDVAGAEEFFEKITDFLKAR